MQNAWQSAWHLVEVGGPVHGNWVEVEAGTAQRGASAVAMCGNGGEFGHLGS